MQKLGFASLSLSLITAMMAVYRSLVARITEQADPADVPSLASGQKNELYILVALGALLYYDTITTMDKEIKYFWAEPRRLVSLIYFLNRYVGILFISVVIPGVFSTWTATICNAITIFLIDYILMMRVLALYANNKKLGLILRMLVLAEGIAMLGLRLYSVHYEQVVLGQLTDTVFICGSNFPPAPIITPVSWAIPLAYGLLLMALALYKATEYWRESAGFRGFALVTILVRGQALYCLFTIFCCVAKIASNVTQLNTPVANLFSVVGGAPLLCVMGSHLLIDMKEAGARDVNLGSRPSSTLPIRTLSQLQFAGDNSHPEETNDVF